MRKFTMTHNNESVKVCEYTAAVREYIDTTKPEELEAFGHDVFNDKNAAWNEYLNFMECNLSGMSIQFHA